MPLAMGRLQWQILDHAIHDESILWPLVENASSTVMRAMLYIYIKCLEI